MSATAPSTVKNQPVHGYSTFMPANPQPIASLIKDTKAYPQNGGKIPRVYQELGLRGTVFKNRLFAAPMCQYSSDYGHATDWHFVHYGSMATRGIGAIVMEATAVVPEGRISPEDAGIWDDSHIAPLKRIVDFCHAQGTLIGIQLAHAGRKASCLAPWVQEQMDNDPQYKGIKEGRSVAAEEVGGWPDNVQAPSAIPFSETYPKPKEMTAAKIDELKKAFADAVERCKKAGFDFIEIHGAHGYLLHNYVSPLSNHRTDTYGGSLPNRLRLPLEIARATRAAWDKPIFYRVSATDWFEGEERCDDDHDKNHEGHGEWRFWGLQQTTIFAKQLQEIGIDLIDVSSGGNYAGQKIPVGPGYQVPFAAHIKKEVPGLTVGAVGLITESVQANEILESDEADVILLARELLRNVDFPLEVAEKLEIAVQPAVQYARAWTRMLKPRSAH
ncbi:hypothetical protein NliqN6_0494 [Naganishia liquefaciens]|uniref:NADH:flavin oxidoreductase/NADH oxidase N-terminal domain-containing protein n=1 Tax=Naganishia liquefaciens TaxID=104408 RepID=A0A8H3TMZ6_9TREE|nr:hypothetical protein NliqN6_0494 [Naganishia liquefaciens]